MNLGRIMVYWPAVTAHLIEVASHDDVSLRKRSIEALTRLVHAALAFPRDPPIQNSPGLQQVRKKICRVVGHIRIFFSVDTTRKD